MSSPCMASLALRGKAFTPKCKTQTRKEFKIDKKMGARKEASITKQDVAEIIPLDLQTTNDGNQVRDRILQRSANALLNSKIIKNSFLMKTASKVEKSTKVDIAVNEANANNPNQATEHRFNMDVQALKGQAKMTYTGYIDSKIEYQATNDTLLISLEEKLSARSKIALSHTKDRQESRQLLQYQVSW